MTYEPKHMIHKEEIIARWQEQATHAAALLSTGRLEGLDGQAWALLECLGKSRELNEILYDYGESNDYVSLHLASRPHHPACLLTETGHDGDECPTSTRGDMSTRPHFSDY